MRAKFPKGWQLNGSILFGLISVGMFFLAWKFPFPTVIQDLFAFMNVVFILLGLGSLMYIYLGTDEENLNRLAVISIIHGTILGFLVSYAVGIRISVVIFFVICGFVIMSAIPTINYIGSAISYTVIGAVLYSSFLGAVIVLPNWRVYPADPLIPWFGLPFFLVPSLIYLGYRIGRIANNIKNIKIELTKQENTRLGIVEKTKILKQLNDEITKIKKEIRSYETLHSKKVKIQHSIEKIVREESYFDEINKKIAKEISENSTLNIKEEIERNEEKLTQLRSRKRSLENNRQICLDQKKNMENENVRINAQLSELERIKPLIVQPQLEILTPKWSSYTLEQLEKEPAPTQVARLIKEGQLTVKKLHKLDSEIERLTNEISTVEKNENENQLRDLILQQRLTGNEDDPKQRKNIHDQKHTILKELENKRSIISNEIDILYKQNIDGDDHDLAQAKIKLLTALILVVVLITVYTSSCILLHL